MDDERCCAAVGRNNVILHYYRYGGIPNFIGNTIKLIVSWAYIHIGYYI